MQLLMDLWNNDPLKCAVLSWTVAQALKVLISLGLEKRLDWKRLWGMGGMPSSHTAFVFSLALMIAVREGVSSTTFALAFALAAVVIYDAMGVRAETGRQSEVINKIVQEVLVEGKPITEKQLKELLGHTPLEVLAGVLVGVIITLLLA